MSADVIARGKRHLRCDRRLASLLALCGTLGLSLCAPVYAEPSTRTSAGYRQQAELVPTDEIGSALTGESVALSVKGDVALLGGPADNGGVGAAWVFVRRGSRWLEQAKLTGSDETGPSAFGRAVALSADGRTALIGGPADNGGVGAAWVFKRSGGIWSQVGLKLTGSDLGGATQEARCDRSIRYGFEWCFVGHPASFGASVALGSHGTTALIGAPEDNEGDGAAWVFTRSRTGWAQQGEKLLGGGAENFAHDHECFLETLGCIPHTGARFGTAVALSEAGDTALIGAPEDEIVMCEEGCGLGNGSAWAFARSGSTWSQDGAKLSPVATSFPYGGSAGQSVALSASAETALIGAPSAHGDIGVAPVLTRAGAGWEKQTELENGIGSTQYRFAWEVALSGDGNTALIREGPFTPAPGAWIFTHSGVAWAQHTERLSCAGAGCAIALSGDASTALVGQALFVIRGK